ncbi:MAG: ATP phosphoribosyltransferase [Oscillospiraceae bacterium]|jgi:ATP phosphoribosyltransferase|nr:ATP phosphoribosyltransferase [Oscillospiraceae bacterium]
MQNNVIRIALTKGRLEKKATELFGKMGFDTSLLSDRGRQLIARIPGRNTEVVVAKPPDVLTFVEHGVCDIGIVGKDTIIECGGEYFEVLDLGFGKCRFSLAVKKGEEFYGGYGVKTVATKYPNVTRNFFGSKGMDVDIVKIEGSVELAPLLDLADGIVDLVETGSTLRENGLEEIEEIAQISARLIVNTVSMKLKKQNLDEIISRIEENL